MEFLPILIVFVALAAAALVFFLPKNAHLHDPAFPLANAEFTAGTHAGSAFTRTAAVAIPTRHLLVGRHADNDGEVILATASTVKPVGICPDEAEASGDLVNILMLGGALESTIKCVANDAFNQGDPVFADAAGEVQNLPAAVGTYYRIGYAAEDAADGATFEVIPHAPTRVVIVAHGAAITAVADAMTEPAELMFLAA